MPTLMKPTVEDYRRVFDAERVQEYPVVDAIEARTGYILDRLRLETAARTLACPVKAHAPNWQHGRVLYSVARQYLAGKTGKVLLLDIGTAKGFSALCLQWALMDAGVVGTVVSVDVIDPCSREPRNTVAEVGAPKTLTEVLAAWPEADAIMFRQSTGIDWLHNYTGRIEFAFVDGKHTGQVVWKEGLLLADRQQPGDVVVFDDLHLPDIKAAVLSLSAYETEVVRVLPHRSYAIARRK